jgi:putative transposase
VRYAWIERHRSAYPVELMCQSLGVSKSGWYAARSRAPSQRDEENARLVTRMHSLQQRHRGRYGRRRMHRALREEVGVINEKRVGRLMRQHGLQSRLRRRFRVVTTDSRHAYPVAPNVLARDFEASAPDRKWLVDLTFVATDEGWLYLALVLDLFGRKFVGWAMSERIDEDLALQALVMALEWRRPTGELMHHSDRGSQYAANDYRKVLAARGITVSMSRKANCWDNAPMESANGTVKVECVYAEHYTTREQARLSITEYLAYYNTERLHSSLGYMSPSEFERRWRAGNKCKEEPAS